MTTILNPHLIRKQGLNEAEVITIEILHEIREEIFERMAKLNPELPEDVSTLRKLAEEVEKLEFLLQEAWKFEQDPTMHSWWYRVPHCQCPKMDNADPMYVNRIMLASCPVHGIETWRPTKKKQSASQRFLVSLLSPPKSLMEWVRGRR